MKDEEQAFIKHTSTDLRKLKFLRELEQGFEIFAANVHALYNKKFNREGMPKEFSDRIGNMFKNYMTMKGVYNSGRV